MLPSKYSLGINSLVHINLWEWENFFLAFTQSPLHSQLFPLSSVSFLLRALGWHYPIASLILIKTRSTLVYHPTASIDFGCLPFTYAKDKTSGCIAHTFTRLWFALCAPTTHTLLISCLRMAREGCPYITLDRTARKSSPVCFHETQPQLPVIQWVSLTWITIMWLLSFFRSQYNWIQAANVANIVSKVSCLLSTKTNIIKTRLRA